VPVVCDRVFGSCALQTLQPKAPRRAVITLSAYG
jgi:hypothetical protein